MPNNQDNIASWEVNDERMQVYHKGQYEKIYRSTEVFVEWIKDYIRNSKRVLDMACGGGANTAYIARLFPEVIFEGLDYNPMNIQIGKEIIANFEKPLENISLKTGDWYNPDKENIGKYDGIISFQTLSWLPDYKEAIKCLAELKPNWIAASSLFFEGNIDFEIKVKNYDRYSNDGNHISYYNVYSLNRIREEFEKFGYNQFDYKKFNIDIDIEQKYPKNMGTYTRRTVEGERLQISGALLMPWYFSI